MTSTTNSRVDAILDIAWVVLIALALFFAVDAFVRVPGRDSGVFMYEAQGILNGEVPYLDRWDHKLPASLLSVTLFLVVGCYCVPAKINDIAPLIEKYTHEDGVLHGKHLNVSQSIRELTGPEDLILVWGAEAQLHLFSRGDAPTRFFYQFPLATPGYADSEVFDEFISDVKSKRPALIIDTRNERLPPLDRIARDNWHISTDRYVYQRDKFQPFLEFVEEEYVAIAEIEGYVIYKRADSLVGFDGA